MNTNITALLIDDEVSALRTLRGMLESYFPEVSILGEARSVSDALFKVRRTPPDVVFLDIEMPPFGNGFDLLEKIPNPSFGVIFVTAYPNYAVQAINLVQPWAYLVKPYSVADLKKAVNAAKERVENRMTNMIQQRIILPDSRKGNVVIPVQDIAFCEADGTTTTLHYFAEGKLVQFVASRNLKDVEEQLPQQLFCRCHHSYLVNLRHISRYVRTGRNGVVQLSSGGEVPISVAKLELFEEQFHNFLNKT